jgi:PRTRC genetic system protein C
MLIETAKRIFKHGDDILTDPDAGMQPDEVREYYANARPELTNGSIEGPEIDDDGNAVYTFKEHVGKKG